MQMENKKILCDMYIFRFVSEQQFKKDVGKGGILSITDDKLNERMIFLGIDEKNLNYELRVYKDKPTDKYIKHESDEVLRYEENDEYATFIFDNYNSAKSFVEFMVCYHDEYSIRPKINVEMKK